MDSDPLRQKIMRHAGQTRQLALAWSGAVGIYAVVMLLGIMEPYFGARYAVSASFCAPQSHQTDVKDYIDSALGEHRAIHLVLSREQTIDQSCASNLYRADFGIDLSRSEATPLFNRLRRGSTDPEISNTRFNYQLATDHGGSSGAVASGTAAVLFTLLVWFFTRRKEQVAEQWRSRSTGRVFGQACLAGLIAIAGSVVWSLALYLLDLHDRTQELMTMTLSGAVIFTALVTAPIVEEVIFRYWLLGKALPAVGGRWSVLISSAAFSLAHFEFDAFHVGARFIAGLAFGVLWLRTRSLWACIVAHMLLNAAAIGGTYLALQS